MRYRNYRIDARTDNYEEYVMQIVARDDEHAEEVATQLCKMLDLVLLACTRDDE